MAVPNTTTFSLQQVADEIDGVQTSLNGCVTDAVPGNYDATYYTDPATSLLEFRNYTTPSGVTVYEITTSKTGQSTAGAACSFTPNWPYYYTVDGAANIVNGTVVYTDTPGVTLFNGGTDYYHAGTRSFRISATGVVSSLGGCF
jgi:hypothetical protein